MRPATVQRGLGLGNAILKDWGLSRARAHGFPPRVDRAAALLVAIPRLYGKVAGAQTAP
jgi:hypothetical protein